MSAVPLRVLFVASECTPWVKTGGLADVAGALPAALRDCGADVRVMMPAYPAIKIHAASDRPRLTWPRRGALPAAAVAEAVLPNGVPVLLVECDELYDREGGPYQDSAGQDWPDNALRFAQLGRIAAEISEASELGWRPQIVHGNDWQAGLAAAYLHFKGRPAASVCTVHNLAFQGLFAPETVVAVGLPPESFALDGVEYHGRMSFLKAGLYYADALTTVSPTYAEEIQREPLGMGLQGLLAARRESLTGILNGIDTEAWDPARDPLIARRYDAASLPAKRVNKLALQRRVGLVADAKVPLFGMVSRLTAQKGIDLVTAIAPALAELPAQLVVLGSGERSFEAELAALSKRYGGLLATVVGFDEELAHFIEAGADIFVMPSRFEPCGLNQMYSQRYGTVPVVHSTGGLADTVVDCAPRTLADRTATGFVFDEPTPSALQAAVERAVGTYANAETWRALQRNGMARDFGWASAAQRYLAVYANVLRK